MLHLPVISALDELLKWVEAPEADDDDGQERDWLDEWLDDDGA